MALWNGQHLNIVSSAADRCNGMLTYSSYTNIKSSIL